MCKYCNCVGTGNVSDSYLFEEIIKAGNVDFLSVDMMVNDHRDNNKRIPTLDLEVYPTNAIGGDEVYIIRTHTKIKYCPICGRNLEN